MKAVIISVVGLLLAVGAQAQSCAKVPTYEENIVQKCPAKMPDGGIMLPNYADATTYYNCGPKATTPTLTNCPQKNTLFTYVYQGCYTCDQYLPAVKCSGLTAGVTCQPIGSGNTPTTTTVTAATPTTKAPATTKSTAAPTTKTTTTAMPGPPTDPTTTTVSPGGDTSGTTVYVPMPPSPNEGPTPPGPDPTVPNLPSGPPVIGA